ncbi:hypothetical protein BX600DRAFT_470060 [Xylariales sp. PMI_506]|nr:hypothetical protein BX600DRAFT_470060 [Xylariales sp. PMI_506]
MAKPIIAQKGSAYDIILSHPGERLMTKPHEWAPHHAELLADFRDYTTSPMLCNEQISEIPSAAERGDIQRGRLQKVDEFITPLFPSEVTKTENENYWLRFGNSIHREAVTCQMLWKDPEGTPLLVYVDGDAARWAILDSGLAQPKGHVQRNQKLGRLRNKGPPQRSGKRRDNALVKRLNGLYIKHRTPKIPAEDQYLIAASWAIAQYITYGGEMASTTRRNFQDVKIRLLAIKGSHFAFYSAVVPNELLAMLHDPVRAPTESFRTQIDYTVIPFAPENTLTNRVEEVISGILKEIRSDNATTNPNTPERICAIMNSGKAL